MYYVTREACVALQIERITFKNSEKEAIAVPQIAKALKEDEETIRQRFDPEINADLSKEQTKHMYMDLLNEEGKMVKKLKSMGQLDK